MTPSEPTTRPSICFVAPNNFGVLANRSDLRHIGGAEIQQPMIAHELMRRGYPVSFITLDHGQPDGIALDGIRVFKMYKRSSGLPVLRFVHPRWTGLMAAMARANAGIYYQMSAGSETGQIALWCRLHGRAAVFATASDSDCEVGLFRLRTRRERFLYRLGLRLAQQVVVQTEAQRARLRSSFGIGGVVIRSCSADPAPGWRERVRCRPHILWVGRFARVKQLELLLELASARPQYRFDVVGAASETNSYTESLRERAARLSNVVLHGRVAHDAVGSFYERAGILCCTSQVEGYPNTFMEAWSRGIPTVSTVDPDTVIRTNYLGLVGGDVTELGACLDALILHDGAWKACSEKARAFWEAQHRVESSVDHLERVFNDNRRHAGWARSAACEGGSVAEAMEAGKPDAGIADYAAR